MRGCKGIDPPEILDASKISVMTSETKRRAKSTKWVDADAPRGEFAENGPLMSIIIEYLLNSDEAFAYAVRCPNVKILGKIGAPSNPTLAICHAVRTKNKPNALELEARHAGIIDWNVVFMMAVRMGNVGIARQAMVHHPDCDLHEAANIAAYYGFPKMMDQIAVWGGRWSDLDGCPTRIIKKVLKEDPRDLHAILINAAYRGDLPMIARVWDQLQLAAQAKDIADRKESEEPRLSRLEFKDETKNISRDESLDEHIGESKDELDSLVGDQILQDAFIAACEAGRVKTARYLLEVYPAVRDYVASGLNEAAHMGHVSLCDYLLNPQKDGPQWSIHGSRSFEITSAAQSGRLGVLRLFQKQCAAAWDHAADAALRATGVFGRTRAAALIWAGRNGVTRATDCESLLVAAATFGQVRSMRQAKAFGAVGFDRALQKAKPAVVPLLEKWIADANLGHILNSHA